MYHTVSSVTLIVRNQSITINLVFAYVGPESSYTLCFMTNLDRSFIKSASTACSLEMANTSILVPPARRPPLLLRYYVCRGQDPSPQIHKEETQYAPIPRPQARIHPPMMVHIPEATVTHVQQRHVRAPD